MRLALWITIFFTVVGFFSAKATHNRGGEITYRHLSGLTYEVKIVTYTKEVDAADRPQLEINWNYGGRKDTVNRVLPGRVPVGADIVRNTYIINHTFPGPGTYTISMLDPNRVGSVTNINGGSSINIPFYIETKLVINPFLGPNDSPILSFPPIDRGCINQIYTHNPGASDPDGDSLTYELVACKGENGLPVPNYVFPDPFPLLRINQNGDFIWNVPRNAGIYNYAILIKEFRNGVFIGSVVRDFQVDIGICNNKPPVFDTIIDTCVLAGSILRLPITARDTILQTVTLTGVGGPFAPPLGFTTISPATFPQPVTSQQSASSMFTWETDCAHIRRDAYQLTFRAEDNGNPRAVSYLTLRVRVIAPAPENLTAQSAGGRIRLQFDPSSCPTAIGYKIYRRQGSNPFTPGACETGMPASAGYTLIDTVMGLNNTIYIDDNNGDGLPAGETFCYRVTAFFSPFNFDPLGGAESVVSEEVCAQVKRDLPVFSKATVTATDANNGAIALEWESPIELDTVQFPAPYSYELYMRPGITNPGPRSIIYSRNFNSYAALLSDTAFLVFQFNTLGLGYTYELEFFSAGVNVGKVKSVSSVYLTIGETDARLNLSWNYNVGWQNDSVHIFRRDAGVFTRIATVAAAEGGYSDQGLINNVEYCYFVTTEGGFLAASLPDSLLNDSQIACGTPRDTVPPCPPVIEVAGNCDLFRNELSWTQDDVCGSDLVHWRIYYKDRLTGEYQYLDSVLANEPELRYSHINLVNSIAGCYVLTSVDSAGNESNFSNEVCVENCKLYELPNVFTPNGDGVNDLWIPRPGFRFVSRIELSVMNRWGKRVFQSTDPGIFWDGTIQGKPAEGGTYTYVIRIFFRTLNGEFPIEQQGMVQLIR